MPNLLKKYNTLYFLISRRADKEIVHWLALE